MAPRCRKKFNLTIWYCLGARIRRQRLVVAASSHDIISMNPFPSLNGVIAFNCIPSTQAFYLWPDLLVKVSRHPFLLAGPIFK